MNPRPKVLHVPAWHPSPERPTFGIFVREHVRAAATFSDAVVWYPEFAAGDEAPDETDAVEADGIRTIRERLRPPLAAWRSNASSAIESRAAGPASALARLMRPIAAASGELELAAAAVRRFDALRREGWTPDLVHVHVAAAARAGSAIRRAFAVPYVVSEHWSGYARGLLTRFGRIKTRALLNEAAAILPVSEDLGRRIAAIGVRTPMRVVPNAVDIGVFFPGSIPSIRSISSIRPAGSAASPSSDPAPVRLVLVAGLVPVKGIATLLRALSELARLGASPPFALDIVGDGPQRAELEALARELGLLLRRAPESTEPAESAAPPRSRAGAVVFRGYLPKPEIAALLRDADFFVLPSEWENLPCALIEALACGLPAVASRVGGVPELIDESNGILVSPGDVGSLAEGLRRMFESFRRFDRAAIARRAAERFGSGAVAARLAEVYREAIGAPARR